MPQYQFQGEPGATGEVLRNQKAFPLGSEPVSQSRPRLHLGKQFIKGNQGPKSTVTLLPISYRMASQAHARQDKQNGVQQKHPYPETVSKRAANNLQLYGLTGSNLYRLHLSPFVSPCRMPLLINRFGCALTGRSPSATLVIFTPAHAPQDCDNSIV